MLKIKSAVICRTSSISGSVQVELDFLVASGRSLKFGVQFLFYLGVSEERSKAKLL